MRILGLIPARGGSKGIPRKNLVDLCGKPLVYYSVVYGNKLLEKGLISECIVSTDDLEIASISAFYGGTPFIRPDFLAKDETKTVDVVLHALQEFVEFDVVALIQPTSPIRSIQDFEECLQLLSDRESVVSVYEDEDKSHLIYKKDGTPLSQIHGSGIRRQDLGSHYIRNGAIYLTKTSCIFGQNSMVDDQPGLHLMSKIRSLKLDTLEDLELLRAVFQKQWQLSDESSNGFPGCTVTV